MGLCVVAARWLALCHATFLRVIFSLALQYASLERDVTAAMVVYIPENLAAIGKIAQVKTQQNILKEFPLFECRALVSFLASCSISYARYKKTRTGRY